MANRHTPHPNDLLSREKHFQNMLNYQKKNCTTHRASHTTTCDSTQNFARMTWKGHNVVAKKNHQTESWNHRQLQQRRDRFQRHPQSRTLLERSHPLRPANCHPRFAVKKSHSQYRSRNTTQKRQHTQNKHKHKIQQINTNSYKTHHKHRWKFSGPSCQRKGLDGSLFLPQPSIAIETPPDVCLQSSPLAFSSVNEYCCVCCKPPSLHGQTFSDSWETRTRKRRTIQRQQWCILLNGSAWSTEKMFVEWYNGTCDIFFGDREQAEERGYGRNVQQRGEARMEVCSRRSKIHSPTSMQAAKIARTRRVVFRWRLRVVEEAKSRQVFFFDMKDDSLKHGYLSDEDWGFFAVYCWHSEGGTPRHEALKMGEDQQAPLVGGMWCHHWTPRISIDVCGAFWGYLCLFVVFCVCVFGYVVVFVLCFGSGIGSGFSSRRSEVTICWTQGITHFKKRAGLRMCLKPIASLL